MSATQPQPQRPLVGGSSQRPPRIGIWGHYHGRNLGDDAVVAAIIANIRARQPTADIVGFSSDPADTCRRHGIPSYPLMRGPAPCPSPQRPPTNLPRQPTRLERLLQRARIPELIFLARSFRRLRRIDALVVAGSGPVYDGWNGSWMHPYNLMKWALLARLASSRLILLCVGAGPIELPLSRRFLRLALQQASYRSYRDENSRALVQELLGLGENDPVYIDLAFSLEVAELRSAAPPEEERQVIGISPMAYEDPRYWPGKDAGKHRAYLERLAAFGAWLLEQGYRLRLLYSDRGDHQVGQDLKALLGAKSNVDLNDAVLDEPPAGHQQLLEQIAGCSAVVGVRFHCHVFPLLLHKPVLGLAYHPKTVDLMAAMGQSDYCLDIETATPEAMIATFQRLQAERPRITAELAHRVGDARAALAAQYDLLFGPPIADADGGTQRVATAPTDSPQTRSPLSTS